MHGTGGSSWGQTWGRSGWAFQAKGLCIVFELGHTAWRAVLVAQLGLRVVRHTPTLRVSYTCLLTRFQTRLLPCGLTQPDLAAHGVANAIETGLPP